MKKIWVLKACGIGARNYYSVASEIKRMADAPGDKFLVGLPRLLFRIKQFKKRESHYQY